MQSTRHGPSLQPDSYPLPRMAMDAEPSRHLGRDDMPSGGGSAEANEKAAQAHDPISALLAYVGAKLPPEDIEDVNRLVEALVKHVGRQRESGSETDAEDMARRVRAGDSRVRAAAHDSALKKFPALGRIGEG